MRTGDEEVQEVREEEGIIDVAEERPRGQEARRRALGEGMDQLIHRPLNVTIDVSALLRRFESSLIYSIFFYC